MNFKQILLLVLYAAALLFAVFFGLYTTGLKGYMPYVIAMTTSVGIIMQIIFRLYYVIRPKGKMKHLILLISDITVCSALLYEMFDMFLTDTKETLLASVTNLGVIFMEACIIVIVVYWRRVFKGQLTRNGHGE